jgi:DNA-binding protein YbaB
MGFLDQFKQLTDIKQKMETVKAKLDELEVSAENDAVKVTATGNRKIKSIEFKVPAEKVSQELLIAAINEALNKAETLLQTEMMTITKGMLPNIPGLT